MHLTLRSRNTALLGWFALVCITCLSACNLGRSGEGVAVEISDSAGVRVVMNPPPSDEMGTSWSVAPEPKVTVGALDGAPEYQLFHVAGAIVLPDDVLVVANQGTSELRFYDDQGRYLHSAGGEGDGPGEFRAVQFVDRYAKDSLIAFDRRQLRASVFDQEGRFAWSFPVGTMTNSGLPNLVGVLSNGRVVIREDQPYVAGVAHTGFSRSPSQLLVSDPNGDARDTLGSFPGAELFVMAIPSEFWMSVRPVTFGRRLVTAVRRDEIAVAETDTFEVRLYGSDGALREIVRQHRTSEKVGDRDVTRFTDSVLATVEDDRSRQHYREMYDLMPKHEVFPAFASVQFDREGNLWVEDYPRPGTPGSTWQVFDDGGVLTARVQLPNRFRALDIGMDYIVGVVEDDLGVEQVRWYSLEKPRP